jgi:hypothetical protein
METTTQKKSLWDTVIELGRGQEPKSNGVANKLEDADIETILATMEFHGATDIWLRQTLFDLSRSAGPFAPRYRVFDWLAMSLNGRNDDDRSQNKSALQVLVHAYLKTEGNVEKFIEDLRVSDYQVDTSWEKVEVYGGSV